MNANVDVISRVSVCLKVDEDVGLDQAVKFCQIQMATSAQRQVGHTHSLCLIPGNNTHSCFSRWNANPIFSSLLTPLETQPTRWKFAHLDIVLPMSTSLSLLSHTHTHTSLSF